ncbi:MAG TPA: hypothetical protein VGR65_03030 [Casimicrobiaceae bacterium]|jgi:hypothetical protein|nr:hypothetical protein [Casimicrobiaceae bacterium]
MPSRRDILKATCGLVLATGGTWLVTHAHGAVPNPPGLTPLPAGAVASDDLEACRQGAADQTDVMAAEL